jgi:CheY-like chemotaxis protein
MTMKSLHLLLVEDDDVDLMAMQRGLRELRLANPVTVAHDGIEALEILRGEKGHTKLERPFVILLDLKMPRMDGLEFLAAIRGDDDLRDSVVFVLTTSRHDEDIAAAYKQNIAGYILKETLAEQFVTLITLLDAYWRIVELPA